MRSRFCGRALARFATVIAFAGYAAPALAQPAHAQPLRPGSAQSGSLQRPLSASDAAALIDPLVDDALRRGAVSYAAFVLVDCEGIVYERGYGRAVGRPIDPERTTFAAASVGKLVTATAVMQQVERHRLALNRDINVSLTRFVVPATFREPVTPAHLLTHTAGFEDRFLGALAPSGSVPDLGGYLARRLPQRIAPPGQQLVYSNHGVALAGWLVEEVTGQSFAQTVERDIFAPLGMRHSSFRQPLPAPLAADFASLGRVPPTILPYPAGSLVTTPADMGRFLGAHLNGGVFDGRRILRAESIAAMQGTRFRAAPGMPGVGYGFFEGIRGDQRHLFHTGDGGHHSLLLLAPSRKIGFYLVFAARSGGAATAFRESIATAFLDRIAPTPAFVLPAPPADFQARAGRYPGLYRMSQHASTTIEKVSALPQQIRIRAPGDGTLRLQLGLGGPWLRAVETGPDRFRVDDGTFVAFEPGPDGRAMRLAYASPLIGDPGGAERIAWYEDAVLHLAFLALTALTTGVRLILGVRDLVVARRRLTPAPRPLRIASQLSGCIGALLALAPLAAVAGLFAQRGPITSVPAGIVAALILLTMASVLSVVNAVVVAALWQRGDIPRRRRIALSVFALIMLGFTLLLNYWNLIGLRLG